MMAAKQLSQHDLEFMALMEKQARVIGFLEGLQVGVGDNPATNEALRLTAQAARDVNGIALRICHDLQDAVEQGNR